MTEVLEALVKARGLVKQGWCQNEFHADGKYCAWGACRTATTTTAHVGATTLD